MEPTVGGGARVALLAAGWVFVAIGTIALAVPLIPTTPFLLVAAACFARSSPRFYQWLLSSRLFGPFIRNYRDKGGITRRQKMISLATMWPMVLISMIFAPAPVWARATMVAAAAAASVYLLRLKTVAG